MANSRIGAENLVLFKLLTDPIGGSATYDVPFPIAKKLVKVGVKQSSSLEPQYADDISVDVYAEDGDVSLSINLTDLTEDEKAFIFGQTMVAGVRTPAPTDVHPFLCATWKSKKRNGKYKFYKILKTMFKEPDEDFETKKEKSEPQMDSVEGIGVQRLSDGLRKRIADEDSSTWLSATGTNWFVNADVIADAVAPTMTLVPLNAATGVATGAAIVFTFNKAMLPSTLIAEHIMVAKAGANIAGILTLNAANTIATFTPTSALSAGVHTAIVTSGVKSASNVSMAVPSVTTFTV